MLVYKEFTSEEMLDLKLLQHNYRPGKYESPTLIVDHLYLGNKKDAAELTIVSYFQKPNLPVY